MFTKPLDSFGLVSYGLDFVLFEQKIVSHGLTNDNKVNLFFNHPGINPIQTIFLMS